MTFEVFLSFSKDILYVCNQRQTEKVLNLERKNYYEVKKIGCRLRYRWIFPDSDPNPNNVQKWSFLNQHSTQRLRNTHSDEVHLSFGKITHQLLILFIMN